MSFKFKPINYDAIAYVADRIELWDDRIMVAKFVLDEKTEGGILLSDETKEKNPPRLGLVIAVGPGRPDYEMRCGVGNVVLFSQYAGTEYKDHETEEVVYILRESDVMGRIVSFDKPDNDTTKKLKS